MSIGNHAFCESCFSVMPDGQGWPCDCCGWSLGKCPDCGYSVCVCDDEQEPHE